MRTIDVATHKQDVSTPMFEYGVGVSTESTYVVKRIDSDFFDDEGGSEVVQEPATK